jgi:hypothetical protein
MDFWDWLSFALIALAIPILGSLVIRAGEKSKEAHDKDPWWWSIK